MHQRRRRRGTGPGGRDPSRQHTVDNREIRPDLGNRIGDVEGDIRARRNRHHFCRLRLERNLNVWIGAALVPSHAQPKALRSIARLAGAQHRHVMTTARQDARRRQQRRQIPARPPRNNQRLHPPSQPDPRDQRPHETTRTALPPASVPPNEDLDAADALAAMRLANAKRQRGSEHAMCLLVRARPVLQARGYPGAAAHRASSRQTPSRTAACGQRRAGSPATAMLDRSANHRRRRGSVGHSATGIGTKGAAQCSPAPIPARARMRVSHASRSRLKSAVNVTRA